MYAINHAATALLIKNKLPSASIIPLLLSVQLMEVFWVIFNYMGLEHYTVYKGKLHLSFLPFSHSLLSTGIVCLISFLVIRNVCKDKRLAFAFAVGVLSHIVIDIIFHEKDIQLSPFSTNPAWGIGIINYPILNFIVELSYGIFCWWYYKGSKSLLLVIIVFNIIDLPMMLAKGSILNIFIQYPLILPSVILIQIVATWFFIWKYSKNKNDFSN